ncbi:MAG: hypothetical protein UV59_C0004G0005 [Candidatus Gottesmanbacteria bacterium GW2011_GWA1_43_11]|uniref:DUF2130 domain-containing protein n=1 Tax=Candidatus Gottesmanbacteria bacterium GW2011_GWA1_43_11 TaxID=1618436 RepID=A0A0G1CK48_9BACT|nr:MAG: hypothetical protein UV59_C0004G0005 [Candidatus Gottesmanbacteria bacterium GW2011_GWA1_43_11]
MTITCPHCQQPVSLDEALTHQLESKLKLDFESKLQQMEVRQQKEKVEMWKIAQEKAAEKLKAQSQIETKLLKEELEEKSKLLEQARQAEVEIRKAKNKLEDEKRAFEVEKMRQLDAERVKIKQDVIKIISEEHQLKDAEKDKVINDLRKSLEDAQRKAQQGSQQLQGEILELKLEELLRHEFPFDEITPVAKGVTGADNLQKIHDRNGRLCGTIIWESKRTKAWSEGWISKLKDDQRAAKAELAVIVSVVLPAEISNFDLRDGVYICNFESVVSLAKILRTSIIEIYRRKIMLQGKNEKKEELWNYLTSTEFNHRMHFTFELFQSMKIDLDKEKTANIRMWARREKQIQRLMDNTSGLRGDLEGLMGNELPELKSMNLPDDHDLPILDEPETNQ